MGQLGSGAVGQWGRGQCARGVIFEQFEGAGQGIPSAPRNTTSNTTRFPTNIYPNVQADGWIRRTNDACLVGRTPSLADGYAYPALKAHAHQVSAFRSKSNTPLTFRQHAAPPQTSTIPYHTHRAMHVTHARHTCVYGRMCGARTIFHARALTAGIIF